MSSIKNPCRLAVFLARQAPTSVILRRGPSNWVEMVRWNTRNDCFEYGQWFKGRIYENKCDLSPDGKLFIYFALKINKRTLKRVEGYDYAWTAISEPPTFTALALWPQDTTYSGGGLFEGNRTVWKPDSCYGKPHPDHQPPKSLKFVSKPSFNTFNNDLYAARLQRLGWRLLEQTPDKYSIARDGRPRLWERFHPHKKYSLLMLENKPEFGKYGGLYSSDFILWDEQNREERQLGA